MPTRTISNTTLLTENPDSASISVREFINVDVIPLDISITGYDTKTNFNTAQQTTLIYKNDQEINTYSGSYYAPLYKEKLNYSEWIRVVNKSFNGLVV